MLGFDTKALILFPYMENYESRPYNYKNSMRVAVDKLCSYLKENGIEPHVFYTDDVARSIAHRDFTYISTLGKADSFFASKYCNNMESALTLPKFDYEDIYNKIIAKDPGTAEMSTDDRFNMVCRHATKAANQIIPLYKIVIHFKFKTNVQYKAVSKAGDNKIRISVDASTFIPEAYMSGMSMDINALLQCTYANRSLTVWEC